MKEIKAYIHNYRIADVIRALKESGQCTANAGCRNINVIPVQSLLKALDAKEQHYSIELAEAIINESKLELICEDIQVDELVGIIERAARTGQAEAGWIYVTDIVAATPIRG
ncbi:nitrogen regulatory protein P-II 1 [Novimethylophilus kurashikiensis]|jgi:nitrogen regulatory protein P-II 1|uniref:Nitrogen regulatory protein P-II 1 n=1 Tax=Novimethylophilus kurashikiensis TaxID=1825523 RepID=A0A2R5FBW5_9PROT|nr:P-II family nitrogen regulator [Novimethylophilus kurashikiensis]GBG15707.1 nitrogen regulatory protein P-II 1 [Novimethylophilus kurashikiensis]